ncbi:MAG TPA: flavin reductase family protein [Chthoniobacterales bacterium]|nr:flavin reductase family protein [Chthoniobacterales bacterium]
MSHLESIIPPLFKKTLGQWASGVTIITTLREGIPHGMTASSFSSLSLDPPLVLVSVDQRARLHQLLPEIGRYGVSILAKGQDLLSTHFAGRPSESLEIPWVEAEGLPFLDGAVAHLACNVFEAVPAGDHIIYIGRITHAQAWPDRPPLLYHCGKYVTLSAI